MKTVKAAAYIAIMILLYATMANAQGTRNTVNRIAAVVDDQIITLYEVEMACQPVLQAFANSPQGRDLAPAEMAIKVKEIKKQVLTELIEQKLLEAEVKRLGIPVSDREIDEYIDKIKAANRMTDEQLAAMLASEGSSIAEFRDRVKNQILREQYVRYRLKQNIEIGTEEARAYYKQNQEQFKAERVISLSEIRIPLGPDATEEEVEAAKQKTSAIYEKILAGGDFTELAKIHSDGPTASEGGSLGSWKVHSELSPSYSKAAEDLKPQQVAPPYRDDKGYVILRCDAWENSGYLKFEEVEDKIKSDLQRQAAQREMKKLAKELRKKSFVDIKIEEF